MTEPAKPRNKSESLSLPFKDYPLAGEYFVTVCTGGNIGHFGTVENGRMQLSPVGIIVKEEWRKTAGPYVTLDAFAIMPGHIHAVVIVRSPNVAPAKPISLGSVITQFKSASAKRIRDAGFREFRWRPGYYEHVVRDQAELNRIRDFIVWNPVQWKPGTLFAEGIDMSPVHTRT